MLCVCVCVCVRARARACMRVCNIRARKYVDIYFSKYKYL